MERRATEELLSKKTSWAFHQMDKDPSDKDGVLEIVNCYIERRLCATELIRRSQRRPAERASIKNFMQTLTYIEADHEAMKAPLESEIERLTRKVRNLTYWQRICNLFFMAAAMFIVARGISNTWAIPVAAIGEMCHSYLNSWMSAPKKMIQIAQLILLGGKFAKNRVATIRPNANWLDEQAPTCPDEAAVVRAKDKLLGELHNYHSETNWVKHKLLDTITG